MSTALLHAKNVTIRFGGLTAVCEFNLELRPHELVGLIGPNGAGKTTIFNMLTGVYKPTEGEIDIGGVSTHDMKPYQITSLGVARTFQNIRLFKDLTVLDNVKIGGHIHYKYSSASAVLHTNRFHAAEDEAEVEADEAARHLRPRARARRRAPRTSRTAISAAWRSPAPSPRGRSCSSSTSRPRASTTARRTTLMETIHDIRDRFDIAILLIEHNMELVMGICERIIVLNFGKTIAEGTPEQVRANDAVIEAYLGEPAEAAEL